MDAQLGLEKTFDEFIKNLCNIFDEVKRVLKKSGTCYVNIGDTYSSNSSYSAQGRQGYEAKEGMLNHKVLQEKSLCMIPFRFAIEMVNRGWVLRNTIIWHKPNCMPSSVKDRFTIDFEYIFFFVKSKRYFFERQLEPVKSESLKRAERGITQREDSPYFSQLGNLSDMKRFCSPEGRNKRSVWSITTKGFEGAHFAVFPEELCETPLKSGCAEFVCKKCGRPRFPIYKSEKQHSIGATSGRYWEERDFEGDNTVINLTKKVGLSDCGCKAGFMPGVVLDPFMGSGTTGVVALRQGKNFIGIELNPKYVDIAKKRLRPFAEQTKLNTIE